MGRGGVFLTDFGLARDTATGSKFTRTGTTLGTPAYMSPEQARGELARLTPASDVWSLGCVLYEALVGRTAFAGDSPGEVIAAVLAGTPTPVSRLCPAAPAGVRRVLAAALAARPADRHTTAAPFRDDLLRVLRNQRVRARVPTRRHWLVLASGASAALMVSAAFVWPGRPAPSPAPVISAAASLVAQARARRIAAPGEATRLLERALDLEPNRDDWRVEYGLLLWAIGEGANARRVWGSVRPGSAHAPDAQLYRGLEAFFRLGGTELCFPEAEPDLTPLAGRPGRVGAVARAALAVMHDRWDEARGALHAEHGWAPALLRAYVETVDPEGTKQAAVHAYDEALAGGIQFGWALNSRGAARRDLGDTDAALRDFERAVAIDPANTLAVTNRGLAKLDMGDHAGALVDFDRALAIDPRSATAFRCRGGLSLRLGDYAGAVADFTRAISIDPALPRAHYNRGCARRALGDLSAALADFDHAIEREPRFAWAFVNRGATRQVLGDTAGAVRDYDRAIEIDPSDPAAYTNRAGAKQVLGDLAGALADVGRALDLDPRHPSALLNRASLRLAVGDYAGAAADGEQAMAVAPPDWPHRAAAAGCLQRAREALTEAAGAGG